jgi:4-carboxymuconolactone decarboxylase
MSMNATAQKNHDELFPNHKSLLKETDPEFLEYYDNFAFDEVIAKGPMEVKSRMRMILASLIACQSVNQFKVMMGAALNVGLAPVEIKEIVYQAVPYVGWAKVFDFVFAANEVLKSRGVSLPLEGQSTTTPETRFEKGLAAQKAIFGDPHIDKMRASAPKDQAHIQDFLAANCFGDHYTRKGLDLKTRELLTFAFLLSMGGCEPQLKGHIQGNVNMGNGREVLLNTITQLLPYVGYPRTLNALKCLNDFFAAK